MEGISELTSTTSQKTILIIAGPNGAGKTTFATGVSAQ